MGQLALGDPALQQLGTSGRRNLEQVASLRTKLVLDQSISVQFIIWLRHALTGDLGTSGKSNEQLLTLAQLKLVATLDLIVAALLVIVIIALVCPGATASA